MGDFLYHTRFQRIQVHVVKRSLRSVTDASVIVLEAKKNKTYFNETTTLSRKAKKKRDQASSKNAKRHRKKKLKRHGKLRGNENLDTSTGTLPYKGITYSIYPKYESYRQKDMYAEKLYETIFNILNVAGREKITEVVINADDIVQANISICADIFIKTITDYEKQNLSADVTDVFFVGTDKHVLSAIKTSCEKWKWEANQCMSVPYRFKCDRITIHVSRGSVIDKEGVDAIVNTIRSDLEYTEGTESIFSVRAGEGVIEECRNHANDHGQLEECETLLTSAGNLPYKGIIHCVVPSRRPYSEKGEYFMELNKTILNILRAAEARGFCRIATPAIGVGNVESTDFNIYARVYVQSIIEYNEQNPSHIITDIHFVDTSTDILLAIKGACEDLETESSFPSQREASSRRTRLEGTLRDISWITSNRSLPPLISSNCRQLPMSAPQVMTTPRNDETRQGSLKSMGLRTGRKRLSRKKTEQETSPDIRTGSRPLFLRHQETSRIPPYQPHNPDCSETAIFQTGQESQHPVRPRYILSRNHPFNRKPLPSMNDREARTPLNEKPHHGTFELTHFQEGQGSTLRNTTKQVPFPSVPSKNKNLKERAPCHRKTGQNRIFKKSGQVSPIKLSSDSIPLSAPPRQNSTESSFQTCERDIRTHRYDQNILETTVYQTSHDRTPRAGHEYGRSVLVTSGSRPLSVRLQHYHTHRRDSFHTGREREPHESAIQAQFLSIPVDNTRLSERIQQELMTQPNQTIPEPCIPIQETRFSETEEFPRYKMDARPRGICLIINNRVFDSRLSDAEGMNLSTRHGTERDTESLEAVFSKLDFMVTTKENLTDHEMTRELADIAINRNHTQYDCFVCCILSHGAEGQVYGSNNKSVEIRQLTSMVQPNMCPSLGGKPKLFFIQACQGCHKQEGTEIEVEGTLTEEDAVIDNKSKQLIPDEADFLLGYSTVPGYVSFRHTIKGTWYIDKLVEILEKYHERMSLLKILTKVNDEVSKLEVVIDGVTFKQMPVIKSTLRKRLLFT